MRPLFAPTILAVSLAASACAPADAPASPEPVTYVGTVQGTDAVLGIVHRGDLVIGYSCGGALTLDDLTTWISGDANGATFELVRGAGTISGTIDGESVTGLVDIDGAEHAFAATRVEPGSASGLYGAGMDDPHCLTGVVVLPGLVQGASTCGAPEETFNQVTPGAAPSGEGFEVVVDGYVGSIVVTPVEVAPKY